MLSWVGMVLGFFLSDLIWASDHSSSYIPDFQVISWLIFSAAGIILAYVRPFFVFSGFLIALFVPAAGVFFVLPFAKWLKRNHK